VVHILQQLKQLYTEGLKLEPPYAWVHPTFYYTLLVFITYFPISHVISFIIPPDLYSSVLIIYPRLELTTDYTKLNGTIWFSFISIIYTLILSIILFPIWYNTLRNGRYYALVAFIVGTSIAVIFATTIDVGFTPDPNLIKQKYSLYATFALEIIKQASMMAIIPLLQAIARYSYNIFRHNLFYSVRSLVAGLIGGLIGFIVISQIAVLSTAFTVGCSIGILLRNSLLHTQNPVLIPILAYIAGLGLPPFWHTFYEILAFSVIGVFGSFITYGIVSRKIEIIRIAVSYSMIGVFVLLTSSITEVTVDVSILSLVRNYIYFTPTIPNFPISALWFAGLIFTLIYTLILIWLVSWFTNYILYKFKEVIE